jgi:protein FrlC
MKFGIMSLDFKRFDLKDCFRWAHDYGFDGLEIFGSRKHLYPWDINSEIADRIKKYSDMYNIEIPMYTPNAINLPFCLCSSLKAERIDGVAYYKKAIDAAKAINVPAVLVVADHPGYDVTRKNAWQNLVESLQRICMYAGELDIKIVIEPLTPMESPIITCAEHCAELIQEVGSDFLYAMMDVVPPVVVQEPFYNYFYFLGDKLYYVHLCNTDGITDAHLRFENGILSVQDVLILLKKNNYDKYVTIELYSENYRDPELILINTARLLKEYRAFVL